MFLKVLLFTEFFPHSPPVVLGVTNPFFVKTMQDWPHLIKICEFNCDSSQQQSNKLTKQSLDSNTLRKHNSNKSLDMKTGVYTKYKPFLHKDRDVLKKLLRGLDSGRPSQAQNAILRRFFIELTQSFLIPLERYFASLMPLARNLSPFKRPPILQNFKIDDFIASLDSTGPQLTTGIKGDWVGLYRRFLRSPNFVCWYNGRVGEANDKLLSLHIESMCTADLACLIRDRPEVEIVDLILRVKDSLAVAESNERLTIPNRLVDKLRENMNAVIQSLPEDSRQLFLKDDKKPSSTNSTSN